MGLSYSKHRERFLKWMASRGSEDYAKKVAAYLDRFASGIVIRTPEEIFAVRESSTSRKYMTVALRLLINYYEEFNLLPPDVIASLRRPLKSISSQPDNYIPDTNTVVEAYGKITRPICRLIYKVLAFSGVRISEGVQFVRAYDRSKVTVNGNVARYPLFSIRKSKRAYYIYLPATVLDEIVRTDLKIDYAKSCFYRVGLPGKYLRKWNYNFLIMHNVPESVADFIQGRSPVSVGSMHYLARVKQADYWYAKVADELVKTFE